MIKSTLSRDFGVIVVAISNPTCFFLQPKTIETCIRLLPAEYSTRCMRYCACISPVFIRKLSTNVLRTLAILIIPQMKITYLASDARSYSENIIRKQEARAPEKIQYNFSQLSRVLEILTKVCEGWMHTFWAFLSYSIALCWTVEAIWDNV